MLIIDQVKAEILAFCQEHKMQPTTFSKHVTGDGHLVKDIMSGVDIRASTIDRIREFMRTYTPPAPPKRRREAA